MVFPDSNIVHRTRPALVRLHRQALWPLALLLVWWISGCAGTASGKQSSVYKENTRAPAATAPIDDSLRPEALVVIRYPAIISLEAEQPFYNAFANNAIGGSVPLEVKIRKDTTRVAQAVIAKTNYFVMSLYRELLRELPENSVLLSPHMIDWNPERELHSRPLLASEQVPSVITIDFSVYSFPDVSKIMDSPPLTFGDIITPLMVVHANRWLRPATHGLVLSSEALTQTSWGLSVEQAKQEFSSMLNYPQSRHQRPLDFITYLSTRNPVAYDVPQKSIGDPAMDLAAVEIYPIEKIQMNSATVAALSQSYTTDPFNESFVKGATARIRALLQLIDHDRALFFSRQAALQRFDPELAAVFLTRSNDESVRSRLQLADALIESEKVFLSAQSQSVYQGTYEGDYGQKMRRMIEAEYGMLEERRRLARIQNVTTAVAAVMLAGSVYGSTVSGSAIASALQSISSVLVLGSIWAVSSSIKTQAKSAKITEQFIALMAPELDRQVDVQVEWLESKEKITARGFAEFRDKTLALYQSRVRSLHSSGNASCSFRHPAVLQPGRWHGRCLDGQASGRGYGLAGDDRGATVEYLGETRDGVADGNGGMIYHPAGSNQAVYYEGAFAAGLPDGVARIEEAGKKPQIRTFKAGVDVGRADERQWRRLVF